MPRGPRTAVLLAIVAAGLAVGGAALADAAFSDAAGDNNEAPDITSVEVSETADGMLTVRATVANYQTLPPELFFNLWFDLDHNTRTGADGDEANILYQAGGVLDFYRWNGRDLARTPADRDHRVVHRRGVHVHRAQERVRRPRRLRPPCRLEPTVVRGRGRDRSRLRVRAEPALVRLARPDDVPGSGGRRGRCAGHHRRDVSDTKGGWITIRATVANFQALPPDRAFVIGIDRDHKPTTGDDGAEVLLTWIGGEQRVLLERWDATGREMGRRRGAHACSRRTARTGS